MWGGGPTYVEWWWRGTRPRARWPVGGGGAVETFVAVEERGGAGEHIPHVLGGFDQRGGGPTGDVLVERGAAIEHRVHIRNLGGIPRADGLIERGGVGKHVPHVRHLRGIPRADGLIERGGVSEHVGGVFDL